MNYRLLIFSLFLTVGMSCSDNKNTEIGTNNEEVEFSDKKIKDEDTTGYERVEKSIEYFNFNNIVNNINPDDTIGFYEATKHLYPFNTSTDTYLSKYHYYDIDGDGDLDLFYDGWSGSEPMMFEISLNVNGQFKSKFRQFIHVKDLFFNEQGILDSAVIYNPGCCAAMTESMYYYKFQTSPDSINAELKLEEEHHINEAKPSSFFDNPISFKINNDNYWLRITPEIDTSNWHTEEWKGNRFIEFHKGQIGTAYAEQADSTGRVWWYSSLDYKNVKVYGWMSSRYLEEIE